MGLLFKKPKKRRPKQHPSARSVQLILVVFVLFALAGHFRTIQSDPTNNSIAEIKNSIVEAAPPIPLDYATYKSPIPEIHTINIKDDTLGDGEPAVCGHTVSVAYTAKTLDDVVINDHADADKPLTFRIGEHKAMEALEQGVVGMAKHGTRTIFAPAATAYDMKGFSRDNVPKDTRVAFHVELLDITPPLPDAEHNVFHLLDVKTGFGPLVLCGEKVKVHLTVKDIEGKTIYSTKDKDQEPGTVTIGRSEVFLGLEQGVIGIKNEGIRSLIVSPAFQKTMNGNESKLKIPFPSKQSVLVDVEALP